jgi:hypothetical protein
MTLDPARPLALPSLLLVLAAACSTPRAESRAAAPAPGPAPGCAAEAAVPASLVRPGSLLLFGEFHGTRELPAMFGEAVCTVARSGAPVTVGLEISRSEQARVDEYLRSPGDPAAEQRLLGGPLWTATYQYGVSSRAMLDLLARLRQLRQAGLAVEVLLFDVDPGGDASTRDARMAERLSDHVRNHAERVVLALMGNYHARTAIGAPWNPEQKFLGWHLRQAGHRVASLDFDAPTGAAWACYNGVASECGPKDVVRAGAEGPVPSPGIHLFGSPSPKGYDGLFTVGSLTPSPPAVAPSGR